MVGDAVEVVSAREVDAVSLVELTAGMRKALLARGEHLSGEWPEEAAEDLRSGRLAGVVLRSGGEPLALGVISARPGRAFAQLHVAARGRRERLAEQLVGAVTASSALTAARADIGLTGLGEEEELELARALSRRPGFEVIRRDCLSRSLELASPPEEPSAPPGIRFVDCREASSEALGALDWRAFQGSPDASFIADEPSDARRLVDGIRRGQLGRFLEEASVAAVGPSGELTGFLLTVEESARVGVFVDLAVDPGARRRGIGRAMLLRGLRALLALGYLSARLWVTESNGPARALYDALGFRPESTSYLYRYRGPAAPAAGPSPQSAR